MVCVSSSWLRRLCSGRSCQSWWTHQSKVSRWSRTDIPHVLKQIVFNTANCATIVFKTVLLYNELPRCVSCVLFELKSQWTVFKSEKQQCSLIWSICPLLLGGTACVPAHCIHNCVFVVSSRCPVCLCCLCGEPMFSGGKWCLQLALPSHPALHEGLSLPLCCHHPPHPSWNNWVRLLLFNWLSFPFF